MAEVVTRIFAPLPMEHVSALYAADLADLEDGDTPMTREALTREVDLLLEELGHKMIVVNAIQPRKRSMFERAYLESAICEDYLHAAGFMGPEKLAAYRDALLEQGYQGYAGVFTAELCRRQAEENAIAKKHAWVLPEADAMKPRVSLLA